MGLVDWRCDLSKETRLVVRRQRNRQVNLLPELKAGKIMRISYNSDKEIVLDGITFDLDWTPAIANKNSEDNRFILLKSVKIIKTYEEFFKNHTIENILEIGIQKGGSVALFNKLLSPRRHVAVELQQTSIPPLAALAEDIKSEGRYLRTIFGVDQGDANALKNIVRENFGTSSGQLLDVVLDDASHLYGPTKVSFNTLFPMIRPNGVYVIEDWGWAHWKNFQGEGAHWCNEPALSNLVFEILMTAATRPDIITDVYMTSVNMFVRRGPANLEIGEFDITKLYISRDAKLNII